MLNIASFYRYIKEFAKILRTKFESRFPECGSHNIHYCISHYLDPYRRGILLEMVFKNMDQVKSEIIKRWSKPVAENNNNTEAAVPNNDNVTGDNDNPDDPLEELMLLKRNQQAEVAGNVENESETAIRMELARYEAMPKIKKDDDIQKWWLSVKEVLPIMFDGAKGELAIAVSSSKSERAFSKSGRVCFNSWLCKVLFNYYFFRLPQL